ncbi:MAG: hypothetical protein JNK75_03880 [Betaproteobacteria bacterium]|nr:hypothetical protein [Betaproteobacteria bacterium]
MALGLNVPVPSQPLPKDIEVNPKKARAWVDTLPLTKTVESAKVLVATLSALNNAKLPAEERVALVDAYRPVLNVLFDELEAIYAYASLPLQARQQEAFSLAVDLNTQCSIAYKLLLLEKTNKMVLFNAKKALPPPLYWSMAYLHALMMQCYRVYHPVPADVWRELHMLHQYAEEQGFLTEVVDTEKNLTMRDLYSEALLVSLADPYRLMNQELDRVLEVLRQNKGQVELRNNAEGLNPQRLFIVAVDSDSAPKVLVQGNRPTAGNILRVVDPTKLVDRLQQRLRSSGGSTTPGKSRATHDLTDLVSRLIRLWGDPPKRQFRRSPTDSSVALCSGIRAICHFTELAAQEDPEADAQAIRDGHTVPLLKIPDDSVSVGLGIEVWQVLNQSANGLRMHREAGGKVAVTVGETVGVRFVGGKTWNVGIVRWLTLLEGDALEFGVELVAPSAESIVIEPTIGSAGRPAPALRLYPLLPGAESDTLLTNPDTFADLREFELRDVSASTTVRATTLVERTSRFDMFQFQ